MGSRLAGTSLSPYIPPPEVVAALPPYPGPQLVRPAHVPEPPLLDPNEPMDRHVRRLARAYVGACEKRLNTAVWFFGRTRDGRGKYQTLLGEASIVMLSRAIAPAAWCAFSLDVWREYGGEERARNALPPVPFVFAPERIEERRGWFRTQSLRYRGGRMDLGPCYRALAQAWNNLREIVWQCRPTTAGQVAVIRAEHLPPRQWKRLLEDARQEGDRARAMMVEALANDEFLW